MQVSSVMRAGGLASGVGTARRVALGFLIAATLSVSTFAEEPDAPISTVRQRAFEAEAEALIERIAAGERRLTAALFPDVEATASATRIHQPGPGRVVWTGKLIGGGAGTAVFAVSGESLYGVVRQREGGVFEIRRSETKATVREIAASGPACRTIAPQPMPPAAQGDSQGEAVADALVVYTPLAEQSAGSSGLMQSLIDASIAATNQSLTNSEVDLTIELAGTAEVDYDETQHSFSFHLEALQDPNDQRMDAVHDLREETGADFVALLVAPVGEYCGIAYIMQTPSNSFADLAFSVTRSDCAVGNLTFPHELGHNMGCAHDRDNAGSSGSYPYSYGYRDPVDATWRTVMAYSPGQRIEHFSNPEVSYFGEPTGVPPGEPDSADNALTINNNASVIAGWLDPPCPLGADLTGDFEVDSGDLGVLLGAWGPCPEGGACLGDLTGDGFVDGQDLGLLLGQWGDCF